MSSAPSEERCVPILSLERGGRTSSSSKFCPWGQCTGCMAVELDQEYSEVLAMLERENDYLRGKLFDSKKEAEVLLLRPVANAIPVGAGRGGIQRAVESRAYECGA